MMEDDVKTSWTHLRAAATGDSQSRQQFVAIYEPVIRHYLSARWRLNWQDVSLDDAIQDVFLECFRPSGVLDKTQLQAIASFRAYLFGVVRNIARRYESTTKKVALPENQPTDEATLSAEFDREYAAAVMRLASMTQAKNAQAKGDAAIRRVELLQLRFGESLPIREIARQWQVDADWLHHQYATARKEFQEALHEVVKQQNPHQEAHEVERSCRELLTLLSLRGE